MMFNNDIFFRNSLIASLAHAIMTDKYPDLSYEQSWDGRNFSLQNSNGIRGTITFEKDCCVIAIRNENAKKLLSGRKLQKALKKSPENVQKIAKEETLQYLLVEGRRGAEPCVSSVFWIDTLGMHLINGIVAKDIKAELKLLEGLMLSEENAIEYWKNYYEMDETSLELLMQLYEIKRDNFESEIALTKEQQIVISQDFICEECKESLAELNIILL